MKDGVLVHVGIEKAASSFLQRHVFSQLTHYRFDREAGTDLSHLGYAHWQDLDSATVDHFRAIKNTRTLVSQEGFICHRMAYTGTTHQDCFLALTNLWSLVGPDCRLLLVVRRQDRAVDSMIRYKQRFLSNPAMYLLDFPVRTTVFGVIKGASLYGRLIESYNYYRAAAAAANIFGREQVHILVYEELVEAPSRFFDRLGVIVGEELSALVDTAKMRENAVSTKDEKLPDAFVPMNHVMRKLNNLTGYRLERILPKRKAGLTPRMARGLLDIFREDNRRLADMFGLDLESYGYF